MLFYHPCIRFRDLQQLYHSMLQQPELPVEDLLLRQPLLLHIPKHLLALPDRRASLLAFLLPCMLPDHLTTAIYLHLQAIHIHSWQLYLYALRLICVWYIQKKLRYILHLDSHAHMAVIHGYPSNSTPAVQVFHLLSDMLCSNGSYKVRFQGCLLDLLQIYPYTFWTLYRLHPTSHHPDVLHIPVLEGRMGGAALLPHIQYFRLYQRS